MFLYRVILSHTTCPRQKADMLVIESCRLSSDARNTIKCNYLIHNFQIQNFVFCIKFPLYGAEGKRMHSTERMY